MKKASQRIGISWPVMRGVIAVLTATAMMSASLAFLG